MRNVTKQIATAFKAGLKKSVGNTMTDGNAVFLHGNKIVERGAGNGQIVMTLSGWNTSTTRERLNGVLSELGFNGRFSQKKFAPMFDGQEIGSHDWIAVV